MLIWQRDNIKPAEKQQPHGIQANLNPSSAKTPKTKLKRNSILYKDITFCLGLNLLIAGSATPSSPFFFIDNLHYKVFKPVNDFYHCSCFFFSCVNLLKILSPATIHLQMKGLFSPQRTLNEIPCPQKTSDNHEKSREQKQGTKLKEKFSFTDIYL